MSKLTLEPPVYLIGEYYYSPTSGVVSKKRVLTRLRAKESALLNALIDHFPHILSREQIVKELYENTYATDATINQLVKRLRNVMDDDLRSLIRTIPKQGYMLTVEPKCLEIHYGTQTIAQKYIASEHKLVESIPANIDELNRVNAVDSPLHNRPRFHLFNVITVMGAILSLVIGYALGYAFTYSPRYLEQMTESEATQLSINELSLTPTVIVDSEKNTIAIHLISEGETVHCSYQDKITLCE